MITSSRKANCVALIIGIGIAILLCEVILRIYPPDFMSDNLWRQYDKDVGWMLLPTANGKSNNGCIVINHINVNSLGFRDKEWSNDETYKIAVLGDSYMEGQHLPEGTIVPQLLERILGVPVLNAGLDGYGTLHEYLVYNKYVAPHQPQLVLLFIYPFNDIQDNSKSLASNYVLRWPQAFIDPSGHIAVHFPDMPPSSDSGIRTAIKSHVKTLLMLWRGYEYWKNLGRWTPNMYLGGVYLPENEMWRDAWKITEFYLVELKHEIEKNGGKLVTVSIPEYIQISPNWERELEEHYHINELPEGFDRDRPLRKLQQTAAANDIPIIRLDEFLKEYRDKFGLPAPYFYYRCDGHLNPLGHFLAANLVVRYLLDHDDMLMNESAKKAIRSAVERNVKLSPHEILSQEGYDQIYKTGRFYGKTNIPNLR
jgi:hypothetical protein